MRGKIIFLLVFSFLFACGKKDSEQNMNLQPMDTSAEERKSGTLLFVTEEYPPYEYIENNQQVGYDIEILTKASELTGIPITIKFVPWKKAIYLVQNGSADAIFALFKNAEREQYLRFPETPLSLEINRVFINKNFSGKIWKLSDLDDKTIGVMSDYSYGEPFDSYKGSKKVFEASQESLIKKLQSNRYQLIVNNEIVTFYLMKKMNISIQDFVPQPLVVGQEPLYIGFSKKAPNSEVTYNKFSEALKTLYTKGEIQTLKKKFVGK